MGKALGQIIQKLLGWYYWKNVERIYVGGGLSEGKSGDILINAASEHLTGKSDLNLDLQKIHYHPAVAALIGITYFIPSEKGNSKIVTVDLGGGNLRSGIIDPPSENHSARVIYNRLVRWQDLGLKRKSLADLIVSEVIGCLNMSKEFGMDISEYIGMGIPALVDENGHIIGKDRNLLGDWTDPKFHLPDIINKEVEEKTNLRDFKFAIKNDAVSQGLSEIPFVEDVTEWGILTIGTGLGNARFRNLNSLRK